MLEVIQAVFNANLTDYDVMMLRDAALELAKKNADSPALRSVAEVLSVADDDNGGA